MMRNPRRSRWSPTLLAGLALSLAAGAGCVLDTNAAAHTDAIRVRLGTTAGGPRRVAVEVSDAGPFTATHRGRAMVLPRPSSPRAVPGASVLLLLCVGSTGLLGYAFRRQMARSA